MFKSELTVSILVSCSAMSAAGNPRMLVGSNLEASGGGLVKALWSGEGEELDNLKLLLITWFRLGKKDTFVCFRRKSLRPWVAVIGCGVSDFHKIV